jgi:hypothetical protein
MLVVMLVVVLFILPPQHAPIEDIHDGALNECLGIVYISINVLCSVTFFDTVWTITPTFVVDLSAPSSRYTMIEEE